MDRKIPREHTAAKKKRTHRKDAMRVGKKTQQQQMITINTDKPKSVENTSETKNIKKTNKIKVIKLPQVLEEKHGKKSIRKRSVNSFRQNTKIVPLRILELVPRQHTS
jgi:hypothetical protein